MRVRLQKITIVAERLLKDQMIDLVKEEGATGFTLTSVQGEGSRGVRASDWEGNNIRLEIIASRQVADAILDRLAASYFDDFAVIAWLTEVDVLRGNKFVSEHGEGTDSKA